MASTNMDTRKSVGKHQGRSEGTAALTSISRDKRSGLVVPGGYSPPSKRGHKEELTTDGQIDLATKLRLTEAEVAILQHEIAELIGDRDKYEEEATKYKMQWSFAMQTCGRVIEQRNETLAKLESLEKGVSNAYHSLTENANTNTKYKKVKVTKYEVDQLRLAIETQIRVSEKLEEERDKANDEYELTVAKMNTILRQHQQLLHSASEMGRERDRALAQVEFLRQKLSQSGLSDSERLEEKPAPDTPPTARKTKQDHTGTPSYHHDNHEAERRPTPVLTPSERDELLLLRKEIVNLREQLSEITKEKEDVKMELDECFEQLNKYEQNMDQALKDRRATESIVHLWRKKYEKISDEKLDLKEELSTAEARISFLQDQLAQERLLRKNTTQARLMSPAVLTSTPAPAERSQSLENLSDSGKYESTSGGVMRGSFDSLVKADSRLTLRMSEWDLFEGQNESSGNHDDEISWI